MQVFVGALGSAVNPVQVADDATIRQVLRTQGHRLSDSQQVMSVQGGSVEDLDAPVAEGQTYLVVPQVRGG